MTPTTCTHRVTCPDCDLLRAELAQRVRLGRSMTQKIGRLCARINELEAEFGYAGSPRPETGAMTDDTTPQPETDAGVREVASGHAVHDLKTWPHACWRPVGAEERDGSMRGVLGVTKSGALVHRCGSAPTYPNATSKPANPLHVWALVLGPCMVVAANENDAWETWCEHMGEERDDCEPYDSWEMVPDDKPLCIFESDDDEVGRTMLAGEWAIDNGPGYLAGEADED